MTLRAAADRPARDRSTAQAADQAGPTLQALLWDVDGTLAETERDGHRVAFNQAFAAAGLPWHWSVEVYGGLLAITGGKERLLHDMCTRADAPADQAAREALASALHRHKNALYAERVAQGGIRLRAGVLALLQACRAQGLRMAVVTTTSRANLAALLQVQLGPQWSDWFAATLCGEDVAHKKPAPEVYHLALQRLGLQPGQVLAVEDSPMGVTAAVAAGCPVVLTRSAYFADARADGAVAAGPGLHTVQGWQPALPVRARAQDQAPPQEPRPVGLDDLRHWHALAIRTPHLA